MTDEFEFFSNDCNNWNYNPFINTPDADPWTSTIKNAATKRTEVSGRILTRSDINTSPPKTA